MDLSDLNEEQTRAILAPIKNILVSAGAGSGKTLVLTNRIVNQLINEHIPISSFLILTFTEAAAKEMKNRIKNALDSEGAFSLIPEVDIAHIQTYDAFRLFLLKKYGYKQNLKSDISIASGDIISVKVHQIIDKIVFEEASKENNNLLGKYIKKYCSTNINPLKNFIFSGYVEYAKNFDKECFFNEYEKRFLSDEFFDSLLNRLLSYLNDCKNNMIYYYNSMSEAGKEKEDKYFLQLFNADSIEDYLNFNNNKTFKKITFTSENEIDKFNHKQIKYYYEKIKEYFDFDLNYFKNTLVKEYQQLMPYLMSLIKKTYDLTYKYKQENGIFEFSDIEILTNKLVFENEDVRNELKKQFKIIMIDEYQDTSDNQDEFISSFAKDNLFLVGDVKQSIYRFRGANPSIFNKYFDLFSKSDKDELINMNTNYRSRSEVTSYVDGLFSKLMTLNRGGIDYQRSHKIISGSKINFLKFKNDEYGFKYLKLNEEIKELDNKTISALMIIKDIKDKIANKYQIVTYNKKKDLLEQRDIKYSDFAILAPTSTWFDSFRELFGKFGIPLNIDKDLQINEDIVIKSVCSLFKLIVAIINQNEESIRFNFVAVLRSFLYSYDDQKIYDLMDDFKNSNEFKSFIDLAHKVNNLNLIDGVDLIYKEIDLVNKVTLLGNGLNYLAKLNFLYERITLMSNFNFSLEDLVEYFEYIDSYDLKLEVKIKADSNNAVKLQTIHKSKGLEYRIVYCVGCDEPPRPKSDSNYISNKNGYYLPDNLLGKTSFFKKFFKREDLENNINERVRLLYVELTRAIDLGYFVVPKVNEDDDEIKDLYDCNKQTDFINYYKTEVKSIDISSLLNENTNNENTCQNSVNVENTSQLVFNIEKLNITYEIKNKNRASKISEDVILNQDKMDFGTHMHLLFECLDLKNPSLDFVKDKKEKRYLSNFLNLEIIKKARNEGIVYKEYEFFDLENNINGIIDLMIVYQDHIDIIDYKLKHIDDEAYKKQLGVYKNYIEKTFNLTVNTYLYSIIENHILKVI